MKKLLQKLLAIFARAILRKYKPTVIGVTGSVGKSSSKDAIVAVLSQAFHVRGNPKNYNNELGVPLAIIDKKTGGRSPMAWLGVFWRAFVLLLWRHEYPQVLVLEMGADHRGDIAYLTKLAPPQVGVLTSIAPVHTEFLGDLEGVRIEKQTLISRLPHTGTAILNIDDGIVEKVAGVTRAQVLTYGFNEQADVRGVEYQLHYRLDEDLDRAGTFFKIAYRGSVVPVALLGVFGKQHVMAALAAAAVGLTLEMNLADIGAGLGNYRPPRGRMVIIPGIKRTVLIDDTYNASPRATLEAVRTLGQLEIAEQTKRIAVLADMKELGAYAEEGHRGVGQLVAQSRIDTLVAVGELAQDIARGAMGAGMPEDHVFHFADAAEAGRFVQDRLEEGDIVLIKGSQSMRMERVVKELMAEPLRAEELLCRQEPEWQVR